MKTRKLGSLLKRRVGPLALWVWLLGLVAAVIFYRRFRGQQAAIGSGGIDSGAPATAGGSGGLTAGGPGADAGGGGDTGQPLQPTEQGLVDPGLANGGIGSPVIFDPTGNGGYDRGAADFPPGGIDLTGDVPPPQPLPADKNGLVDLPGGAKYDPGRDVLIPPKNDPHPSVRPRKTTGQRTPKKKITRAPAPISENSPKGHPTSKGHTTPPANTRAPQPHAPATTTRPRSGTAAKANNNVRSVTPVSENSPAARPRPPARGSARPLRAA